MRQRLSSEKDRYRGRRRVPTPPRSRYAIVVTGAFVGAGVVAMGASAMPDAKAVDPQVLAGLNGTSVDNALQERADQASKASRSERTDKMETSLAESPDVWQLPLSGYTFTNPYGMQGKQLHAGIDLVAPEGTPFAAVHDGVVKEAGWIGGYGMAVIIDHGDGTEVIYGHARQVLVQKGQQVKAGDMIGLVGSTGHAYGSQLCIETQVDGESTDPIPFFKERGVDIQLQVASIYG
ncbi:M23 family metallopeptidase [Asanoa sp. WMMD1127]|uniref:M23 family metallopeptidase n=1 Tax=Asanoa sp. WMMD1127 TaxID=3016107 RepID=UPI00241698F9|nr:M23 family metallopeptidase [Asanoa sp. WMMD1127]MDG4821091.1 M23 family metallopeptidase [Asanoa sp. WMMD1127]